MRHRFSLYRVHKFWYARFHNPQTGAYVAGRSTGQTTRDAAAAVAAGWLRDGVPDPAPGPRRRIEDLLQIDTILASLRAAPLTHRDTERVLEALRGRGFVDGVVCSGSPAAEELVPFLERFWDYERSPYVADKRAHEHRIGRRHCYDMALHVANHWRGRFGGRMLGSVRKADLDALAQDLRAEGLKPKTLNNILAAGTVALRWAANNGFVPADPTRGVLKFSGAPARRGVLTDEEAARVLAVPWTDERARLGNALAMTTGLRAGEVLAVQVRDIGEDRLHVRHSWSVQDRLKAPKNGCERMAPLVPALRGALLELARKNPHGVGPTSFVFWSVVKAEVPMDQHFLLEGLKAALVRVRVTADELADPAKVAEARAYWKTRAVVFHSWRHLYAARMADRLEARVAQVATGHADPRMLEHYADHRTEAQVREVGEAAESAFGALLPFAPRKTVQ